MKRRIKKIATVALTMTMVSGMMVSGSAATNVGKVWDGYKISLSGGYADCYIECDNDYASASTDTYAYGTVDSISAYVDVSFDMMDSTGYYEYVGSDSDSDSPNYGMVAYASCGVSGDGSYSVKGSASSYHEAEIDGVTRSHSLSVEN